MSMVRPLSSIAHSPLRLVLIPQCMRTAVKDNKDGTYEAQFTLRRAGDFLVDVVRQEISDKLRLPIFGSPFPIFCFPAASHGPKCEAEGTLHALFK